MKENIGNPVTLTNEEIRESGVMPEIIQAMEHSPLEASIDPVSTYTAIEHGVVGAYKTIERNVVGAYKAVEQGAVEAYRKVEDTMVDKLFRKEGETIVETKERLQGKGTRE